MVTPSDAGDSPEAKAERARKIKEAMAWLRTELGEGSRSAGEMQRRGQAAGHAPRTLQEAAKRLHIHPQRVYEGGKLNHWEWSLPAKKR